MNSFLQLVRPIKYWVGCDGRYYQIKSYGWPSLIVIKDLAVHQYAKGVPMPNLLNILKIATTKRT